MSNPDFLPSHPSQRCREHDEFQDTPLAPPQRSGEAHSSEGRKNASLESSDTSSKEDNSREIQRPLPFDEVREILVANFASNKSNRISSAITRGLVPGAVPVYPVSQCLDMKPDKDFKTKKLPKYDEEEMTIVTEEQSHRSMEEENLTKSIFTPNFEFASRRISLLVILVFLLAIALALGLVLWMEGNKSNAEGELPQDMGETLNEETFSPNLRFPISLQPSTAPSLSTLWSYLGEIDGDFIGEGVEFTDEMVVVSSDTQAQVYHLDEDRWEPLGESLLAEILCTSESNRIITKEGEVVRAYDFSGGGWMQVGADILPSIYPENVSVSGDGSTITISVLQNNSLLRSQIYRIDNFGWSKLGEDIRLTVADVLNFQSTLSFDGNILAFGFANEAHGFSTAFNAPSPGYATWKKVLNDGKVYGGGPSIAMADGGSVVLTAGNGLVSAYTIDDQNIGKRLKLEGSLDQATLAIAGDGSTFAYAWQDNLRVVDLVNGKWIKVGPLPEIPCSFISSLSFSKGGKLAVGCPDDGGVHIVERQK